VLGIVAEQLKLAQSELDTLTEQLRREMAQDQARAGETAPPGNRPGDPAQPNQNQSGPAGDRVAGRDQPGQAPGGDGQPAPGQPPGGPAGEQAANSPAQANAGGQSGANAPGTANPAGNAGRPGGNRDQLAAGEPPNRRSGGGGGGGDGARNALDLANFFDGRENAGGGAVNGGPIGGAWNGGPLTGGNFGPWTERLRDVETLLDSPELRAALAAARERARLMRRDIAVKHEKPDWAVVQLEILKPLVEVRGRVAEEIARRDPRDQLAPIDRDPVPNRFADSVRRYYEELGKDQPDPK
jgi:hypothetical protein